MRLVDNAYQFYIDLDTEKKFNRQFKSANKQL